MLHWWSCTSKGWMMNHCSSPWWLENHALHFPSRSSTYHARHAVVMPLLRSLFFKALAWNQRRTLVVEMCKKVFVYFVFFGKSWVKQSEELMLSNTYEFFVYSFCYPVRTKESRMKYLDLKKTVNFWSSTSMLFQSSNSATPSDVFWNAPSKQTGLWSSWSWRIWTKKGKRFEPLLVRVF